METFYYATKVIYPQTSTIKIIASKTEFNNRNEFLKQLDEWNKTAVFTKCIHYCYCSISKDQYNHLTR